VIKTLFVDLMHSDILTLQHTVYTQRLRHSILFNIQCNTRLVDTVIILFTLLLYWHYTFICNML